MKETMVIRKTNGDEQATPPAAEKCKRKRDWLAGVVQSESFKRLMDSKGTLIFCEVCPLKITVFLKNLVDKAIDFK